MRRSAEPRLVISPFVRRGLTAVAATVACVCTPAHARGAEANASIVVQAQISSRTSLTVSTESLHFDVVAPFEAATAAIDFSAAARTYGGVDVLLSIELLTGPPDSAASTVSFVGEGQGTLGGTIPWIGSSIAARWNGSGHRTGRFIFALRSTATGAHTIPVRFLLTAP